MTATGLLYVYLNQKYNAKNKRLVLILDPVCDPRKPHCLDRQKLVFGRGGVWLLFARHGEQGLGTEEGLAVMLDCFHLNAAGSKC